MTIPRPALRLSAAISAAAAGLAAIAIAGAPGMAAAADAAHPEVVELFQSQGCSSCPPANANVMALADRPDLLVLSWQVTYWDNLGWKDTFGSPAYTRRQWDYARGLHHDNVFTPQVVVNGRADAVGVRRDELADLIRRADRGSGGPDVTLTPKAVTISGAPAGALAVLVRYDPRVLQVPIARGENSGRTLPHRNIVRDSRTLGVVRAHSQTFPLPPAAPGLRTAVLVEAQAGGPILAAARG